MPRPRQERREGDGCPAGLGGPVVAGGDAAPPLQAVEAALDHVAPLVALLAEGRRASATTAASVPATCLAGPFRDSVPDIASSQPGAYGFGPAALVADNVVWSDAGPSRTGPGCPDHLRHGLGLGTVPLGHVPPGPGPELPHDPVEDRPAAQAPAAPPGRGQQRLHEDHSASDGSRQRITRPRLRPKITRRRLRARDAIAAGVRGRVAGRLSAPAAVRLVPGESLTDERVEAYGSFTRVPTRPIWSGPSSR